MTSSDDSEKLLGEQRRSTEDFEHLRLVPSKKKRSVAVLVLGFLYVPIVVFVIILATKLKPQCEHPVLIPSPARESGAIRYGTKRIKVEIFDNPFAGDPSEESDLAWHNMLESNNIRVSGHDLRSVNLTSLELADGGYVVQPGFYHELHCLKRIRHWVYHDYYHHDDTTEQSRENKAHVDHCIEMLRVKSICNADMSFSTFRWLSEDNQHPTAGDYALHQCVEEDRLMDWIHGRAVHLSHPGTLRMPS